MGSCTSSKNTDKATTYTTQPNETRRNNADLINIIPVYDFIYHDRYAKYMRLSQKQLLNTQLQFGDIIQITNPSKYNQRAPFVVGNDNQYIPCITTTDTDIINIPYCICSKLSNPVAFYSKLIKKDDEHQWKLTVRNNDEYIIHRFGGILSEKYHNITLSFKYDKLIQFEISFDGIGHKIFDTESWNYNNKDIDEFYEIRIGSIYNDNRKTSLVIMEIESDNYQTMKSSIKTFPSSKWEYIFKEFNEYNNHIFRGFYIGPRNEQEKMKQIIESEIGKFKYFKHSVDNYLQQTQISNLSYTVYGYPAL